MSSVGVPNGKGGSPGWWGLQGELSSGKDFERFGVAPVCIALTGTENLVLIGAVLAPH